MTQTPPISAEQVEAAARAICKNQYLAGHAEDAVGVIVDYRWKEFARDAAAALTAAASIPASRGEETLTLDGFGEALVAAMSSEMIPSFLTDAGCDHDALGSAVDVLRTQQAQRHRSTQHALWEAIKDYAERANERETNVGKFVQQASAIDALNDQYDTMYDQEARAEAAEAKVERLTEALKPFAEYRGDGGKIPDAMFRRARAALGDTP